MGKLKTVRRKKPSVKISDARPASTGRAGRRKKNDDEDGEEDEDDDVAISFTGAPSSFGTTSFGRSIVGTADVRSSAEGVGNES